MRRATILRLALAVCLVAAPARAQEPAVDELLAEVGRELAAGRRGEAVRLLWEVEAACTRAGDTLAAARAVGRIGECLVADQRWESARDAFRDRLQRLREHFGPRDDAELARAMGELAFCLQQSGRVNEALDLFEQSLAMQRRLGGDDSLVLAIGSSNVAFCLLALGRGEEALRRFEETRATMRALFGDEHEYVAIATSNLGTALAALGRHEEALERFQEALALRRRLLQGDDSHVARALSNLGSALAANGELARALERHEQAYAMRRRLYAGDHPELVASLNNLGGAQAALDRHEPALARFREALEMARRLAPNDQLEAATLLNNIGATLLELGRPAEALFALEAAESAWRRLARGDHPGLATSLDRLGACLEELGELEEALPKLKEALAMRARLYGGDHRELAASYQHLGDALMRLGDALGRDERVRDELVQEAMEAYRAALSMRERLYGGDHPEIAESLNDYALGLQALGAFEQALDVHEDAWAMWSRLRESDPYATRASFTGAAGCVQCLGRGDETIAVVAEGLALLGRGAGAARFAADLGRVLVDELGRPEEALSVLAEAIGELEAGGARGRGVGAETYDTMVRAQVLSGQDALALEYAERARVRRLAEEGALRGYDPLGDSERRALESGDRERAALLGAAREALEESARELSRLEALARESAPSGRGVDEELAIARACHAEAIARCAQLAGGEGSFALPASAEELQALLGAGQRLAYYALSEEQSFVFLVPPVGGAVRAHALLWPDGRPLRRAELEPAVDDYLRAMAVSAALAQRGGSAAPRSQLGSGLEHAARGHALFRALMPAPAWEELRDVERLIVVTDGALGGLAFEALVLAPGAQLADSRFWGDEPRAPALVYVPSGSFLAAARAGAPRDAALAFLRSWRGGSRELAAPSEGTEEGAALILAAWPGIEPEPGAVGSQELSRRAAELRAHLRRGSPEPWRWAGVVLVGDAR